MGAIPGDRSEWLWSFTSQRARRLEITGEDGEIIVRTRDHPNARRAQESFEPDPRCQQSHLSAEVTVC
jgi:hypothetical protein